MTCLRVLFVAAAAVLAVLPLRAQETIVANRFMVGTALCVLRSGSGSPEGAVVGEICDVFLRTDTGVIYVKNSGTGNTGWLAAVAGTGSTNALTKWTSATTLGETALNESGTSILPDTGYVTHLGALHNKFLSLHAAELWVETLVAQNTIATIGGRVLVAPTNILTSDLSTSATQIVVKYNNFLQANGSACSGGTPCTAYLEADGKVEFIHVTSDTVGGGAGAYQYNVTRNVDGSGANDWFAGDAILNTGTAGNGFIDIYSLRGIKASTELGPTIVGNIRNSTTYNDWSPRWAIGNLNGLYGYSADTYGAAFGVPTAAWIKIDPTNGIRIGHNVTTKISLDASGDASFAGSITATSGSVGGWSITSTRLSAGSGTVGMDASGSFPMFWAGHATPGSAPFRVALNGDLVASSATITGAITATSGDITAALVAGSITSSHIAANTIVAADIAAATITADRLSVSTLSAISANLGTITAGTITGTTITAGGSGGEVTLNSSGITLTSGSDGEDRIKWSDGSYIQSSADTLFAVADSISGLSAPIVQLNGNGEVINFDGSDFTPAEDGNKDLGESGSRWDTLFALAIDLTSTIKAPNIGSSTGTAVILDGSGFLRTDSSSERYKTNIARWQPRDPYAVLGVRPIKFDYINGGTKGVVGLSAEQLASISPDLVNVDGHGRPESIRQAAMNVYLIEVIRELRREIEALKKRK